MILHLLGALLLTTCIGSGAVQKSETATNFNNEQKHHTISIRNTAIDEDGEGIIRINTFRRYNQWQSTDNTHWLNRAYEFEESTNTMNVRGNVYTYLQTNGSGAKLINRQLLENGIINYTNQNYITTCRVIYVLQITPYAIINDNEMEISVGLTINTDQNGENIGANIKEWKTTNNQFANYMQRNNLNAQNSLYNLEREIQTQYYSTHDNYFIESIAYDTDVKLTTANQSTQITYNTPNYFIWEYILTWEQNSQDESFYITYPTAFYDIEEQQQDGTFFNISWTYTIPTGTGEIVDIPGLMFDILTMPFAFISQAFNLTLFPGTPYQVNISNLLLTLIGVVVFITIINMIVKR